MNFFKSFQKGNPVVSEEERLASYRKTGELRLLGEIYQPYMPMVFSVCYKYLKDEEESKDAVMNIFEKLVTDLRVHEVSNFKSWLHSVARNYCLMQMRSKTVVVVNSDFVKSEEESVAVEFVDEEGVVQFNNNLAAMEQCLDALAEEQKVTISLFYKEEKCYQEISDQTGFDLKKVKSYIQNGKRNLKICIEKNGKG